jgi:riboflavin synthase|tara:strand:- start:14 stop:598 length:585 start_codon:yes stop_codon:yes gene_type:complete
MFNGIIYKLGVVSKIYKHKNYSLLGLTINLKFKKSEIGSSLCCNGSCLTITKIQNKLISFYLSKETLKRTNFASLRIGNFINIEKSINYGSKISGHYVQGHVDTTALISKISIKNKTWIVTFKISKNYKKFLIDKGSITINGVSLTISQVKKNTFQVNIIPHTLKLSNLIYLKKNNLVNIEFDIFSKYLLNLKN